MKVLILGGNGMLGHKVWAVFKEKFDTFITIKKDFLALNNNPLFIKEKTICNVNVLNFDSVKKTISSNKPDVIINCVGIIKQISTINDEIPSIEINSLLPHKLANLCETLNIRLICISTDCVFSGQKGGYTENDLPDPVDFYGMSKALGEIKDKNALTIRTSIIGNELNTKYGLFEWFLSNKNQKVKGYSKTIYTGFTTLEFSKILGLIIEKHKKLKGLYHISSDPINKYDLLILINKIFKLNIDIEKDDSFSCDRSLDSSRFRQETNYSPPAWESMIDNLAKDQINYPEK